MAEDFKDPTIHSSSLSSETLATGFDVPPPSNTMYVDKPMRDHGLLQAIRRG